MQHRREIKLILPALQFRLIAAFLILTVLALFVQYALLQGTLTAAANELPRDGTIMLERLGPLLLRITVISGCLILPLTFVVGVIATHSFAGPVHRLRQFLRAVIDGKRPADCQLRQGDQLQDLCSLINEATAPMREQKTPDIAAAEARPGMRAAG